MVRVIDHRVSYLYVRVVPKSSKRLHQAVLTAALGYVFLQQKSNGLLTSNLNSAPMTFLSTMETGTLVNRYFYSFAHHNVNTYQLF